MSFDFDEVMRGAHERVARERGQQRARDSEERERKARDKALRAQIKEFLREGAERLLAAGIEPDVGVYVAHERRFTSKPRYEWYESGWALSDCAHELANACSGVVFLSTGYHVYAHDPSCIYAHGGLTKNSRLLDTMSSYELPRDFTVENAADYIAHLMSKR